MTGRDLPTPDDNDVDSLDAVERHKIRYNPSSRTRLDSAEEDGIPRNRASSTADDSEV